MSVGDLYREFELYLEKAQNDISQAFENGFKKASEENEEERIREEKRNHCPDWGAVDGYQLEDKFDKLIMRYNVQPQNYIPTEKSTGQYSPKTDQRFYKINGDNFDIQTDNSFNTCNSNESASPTISQPSPSQSCTSLTSFSSPWPESPIPSILAPDQDISDDSISFMSADALEDRAHNKTRFWNLELAVKSSSAPTLERDITSVNSQPRSQSDRHLSEVEAIESCKWLRLAGFPQYAQMYEENLFPIDLRSVEKDHPMLDISGLNSLFRRLQALNNFAHLHQQQRVTHDDSEDEQCALSNKWIYEAKLRRWSRIEQNLDIPSSLESRNQDSGEDAIPGTSGITTRDNRRRLGSTKNKRRIRDGIVLTDSNPAVLEILSEQLHAISATNSAPDSPNHKFATNPFSYRNKSRSLEKNDSTPPYSPSHVERVAWKCLGPINTEETVELRSAVEEDGSRSIFTLSCTQLQVLRKVALLNLTEYFEKYCPTHKSGWNWYFPKLIRKKKSPSYKGKNVFGVPLGVILQRAGCSLPKGIIDALQWLEQNCYDQDGLFRTCGVKSRIVQLKEQVEAEDDSINYSEVQACVIVGMIKQYFKDLPECLFTSKLSETFTMIFQFLPLKERPDAIACALLLMPDEHREVLMILLGFLNKITSHSEINLMTNKNISVCLAGSLFNFDCKTGSPKNISPITEKEVKEAIAANDCLNYLLDNFHNIFKIPKELSKLCSYNETVAVPLSGLKTDGGNWKAFLEQCQNMLLKEVFEKGWVSEQTNHPKIDLAYKEVADGYPLHLWKVTAEIEAPPTEVLHRILRERPKWDEELQSSRIIAEIGENIEILQYACRSIDPLPLKDYCVVRLWKYLPKNACSIIETSIEHPDVINIPNSIRGIVLACRYYIEPCGSGKSRLINLSRVDTRGRMPEWYRKNYGHVCAFHMAKIQHSFKLPTSGMLESNV